MKFDWKKLLSERTAIGGVVAIVVAVVNILFGISLDISPENIVNITAILALLTGGSVSILEIIKKATPVVQEVIKDISEKEGNELNNNQSNKPIE